MYCPKCVNEIPDFSVNCGCCGYQFKQVTPAHHLHVGSCLASKYYIGNAIGEGGFGITYIGRDTKLDVRVAVKEFFPSGFSTRNNAVSNDVTLTSNNKSLQYEKSMERFLREARTLAKFADEPGIVGVKDFFQENGTAYIVMEYLDGITLKEYIKQFGVIKPKDMVKLIDPVLLSLKKVHEQGLIHRDISPDNIMILSNGRVKLLDFGAARDFTDSNKSLSIMLKHGYAPEEQYRTKGEQGPWTDVYAICATMYKCMTGSTPEQATQRAFDEEDSLKPISSFGINIEPHIEEAIIKGMSIRKKDRYQSMEELKNAFANKDMSPEKVATGDGETMSLGISEEFDVSIQIAEPAPMKDNSKVNLKEKSEVKENSKPKGNGFFKAAGKLDDLPKFKDGLNAEDYARMNHNPYGDMAMQQMMNPNVAPNMAPNMGPNITGGGMGPSMGYGMNSMQPQAPQRSVSQSMQPQAPQRSVSQSMQPQEPQRRVSQSMQPQVQQMQIQPASVQPVARPTANPVSPASIPAAKQITPVPVGMTGKTGQPDMGKTMYTQGTVVLKVCTNCGSEMGMGDAVCRMCGKRVN